MTREHIWEAVSTAKLASRERYWSDFIFPRPLESFNDDIHDDRCTFHNILWRNLASGFEDWNSVKTSLFGLCIVVHIIEHLVILTQADGMQLSVCVVRYGYAKLYIYMHMKRTKERLV